MTGGSENDITANYFIYQVPKLTIYYRAPFKIQQTDPF